MVFALLSLSLPSLAADVPEAAEGLGNGVHVVVTETFDAPPTAVWAMFSDFAAIDQWSSGIDASRAMTRSDLPEGYEPDPDAPMIGRVVTTNGREQTNTLVDYDDGAMRLTFRAGGLPRVLRYAQNTHTVEPLEGGGSRVTVEVYLVPGGVAKLFRSKIERKFTGYMIDYLAQAKRHVERIPTVAAEQG